VARLAWEGRTLAYCTAVVCFLFSPDPLTCRRVACRI
jgi:hypothetical protein